MPRYRVIYDYSVCRMVEVEARDEAEALDKGEQLLDRTNIKGGSWEWAATEYVGLDEVHNAG